MSPQPNATSLTPPARSAAPRPQPLPTSHRDLYYAMLAVGELAEKYRNGTASRYDGHRLLEYISWASELTGLSNREIWLDLVDRDYSPTRR